ncbi:hypothetical protein BT69DRAFT_1269435 [Atractiella rhizophila]|nr:hypothetical protein BT69DRAFT_1269435 [Atractiella rhizophila]
MEAFSIKRRGSLSTKRSSVTLDDSLYGYRDITAYASALVVSLFPKRLSLPGRRPGPPPLPQFYAYALYRTDLPTFTVLFACHLLRRLARYWRTDEKIPAPADFHHRLLLTATIMSCNYLHDEAYSLKSWSIASQGMLTLRELRDMQLSMFANLDWKLRDEGEELEEILDVEEGRWKRMLEREERERLAAKQKKSTSWNLKRMSWDWAKRKSKDEQENVDPVGTR